MTSRANTSALLPAQDVTPAARITAIVTELGAIAPEPDALAATFAARQAKRPAIGPAYVPPATTATAGTAADDDDGPATPDGRAPGSPDDEDEAPEDGS